MAAKVREARSLAPIKILSGLAEGALQRIHDACRWAAYAPGDTLIGRGEDTEDVFFLLSGSAHVMNFASLGRIVAFAALEAGEYFGELTAIDGQPRSATVVAATSCMVAILPGSDFRRIVHGRCGHHLFPA